ncbi:MAG: thioredoxin [Pyrinomonadaceae bacterium]
MTPKTNIVRCLKCGSRNRIHPEAAGTPVCGSCKKNLKVIRSPVVVTDANFNELVERSKLPVLLDLWATWCPPCRMLAPIIDAVAKEMAGAVIVGKLDVDANRITAGKFSVRSIPTMIIFKNGTEAERIVGLQTKEAILQKLKRFL